MYAGLERRGYPACSGQPCGHMNSAGKTVSCAANRSAPCDKPMHASSHEGHSRVGGLSHNGIERHASTNAVDRCCPTQMKGRRLPPCFHLIPMRKLPPSREALPLCPRKRIVRPGAAGCNYASGSIHLVRVTRGLRYLVAVQPPSTTIDCPLIISLPGRQRNAMTEPTSSGCARRG